MSSPYGPNDPQQPGWNGQQQPYQGSYGQQPGAGQQAGWGAAPQQGYPGQGYPGQQGQQGPPPGYPAYPGPQQPYGPPSQQPYGAPGQPQYGQPNPSSQFGAPGQQFGQPAPYGAPGGPKKSKTPLIAAISAVVVVIAVLLITAFLAPGWATSKVLDASAVQDGVQKVLTDTYKVSDVSKVSCPADQKVIDGGTFTCKATIGGKDTDVKITITDDNGTYQVGRP